MVIWINLKEKKEKADKSVHTKVYVNKIVFHPTTTVG